MIRLATSDSICYMELIIGKLVRLQMVFPRRLIEQKLNRVANRC